MLRLFERVEAAWMCTHKAKKKKKADPDRDGDDDDDDDDEIEDDYMLEEEDRGISHERRVKKLVELA